MPLNPPSKPPVPPAPPPGSPPPRPPQGGGPPASSAPPAPPTPPAPPAPPASRASRTLPRSRVTIGQGAGAPTEDDIEKLEAIRDVMEYAAKITLETALAKPMRSYRARPIALGVLGLLSLSLVAFTFLREPDWVFGPEPALVDPARREAHTRYAMFLVAQRLESLRDSATGNPPASLAETGDDWLGFDYRVFDLGVYELRGRTPGGGDIVLKSGEDLAAFLKDGRKHLREARP